MTYRSLARALIVPLLLGVLCLGFGAASPRVLGASAGSIQGDVDCSGTADAADSLQVLQGVAGSASNASRCVDGAGDVDCDGNEDLDDALNILRFTAGLEVEAFDDCVAIGNYLVEPPTSEALIAAAREAGDIAYEDSLRARAFALYDDPRLDAQFRSPIIDYHAGRLLAAEIETNRGQLSQTLLDDVEPILARPNDPRSIFYDLPTQPSAVAAPAVPWRSLPAGGGLARVWMHATSDAPLTPYADAVTKVWPKLVGLIGAPNPDSAAPPTVVNPDTAIDLYFLPFDEVDPRSSDCAATPNDPDCSVGTANGYTSPAAAFAGNKSSAYVMIKTSISGDELLRVIAHELAHTVQNKYDYEESDWLSDSTADWASFRVLQMLPATKPRLYKRAKVIFDNPDKPLSRDEGQSRYAAWLYFFSLSIEKGDTVFTKVWEKAAGVGQDSEYAVNEAFKFDDYFDDFATRNWNQDPVQEQYKTKDSTFPNHRPKIGREHAFTGYQLDHLDIPVTKLSSVYYDYHTQGAGHITFENLLFDIPHAHVWAIKQIDGVWQTPEDWTRESAKTFCRNAPGGHIEELVIIISNSGMTGELPVADLAPRITTDPADCTGFEGTIEATVHSKRNDRDLTYVLNKTNMTFTALPYTQPGTLEFQLETTAVTWNVSGTIGDCTASGQPTVNIPGPVRPVPPATQAPIDTTQLAWGYLVVVLPGEWHGVLIEAYGPGATFTVTCPGDPPHIYEEPIEAVLPMDVLMWNNTIDNGQISLVGECDRKVLELTAHYKWHLDPVGDPLAPLTGGSAPAAVVSSGCGYPEVTPPPTPAPPP